MPTPDGLLRRTSRSASAGTGWCGAAGDLSKATIILCPGVSGDEDGDSGAAQTLTRVYDTCHVTTEVWVTSKAYSSRFRTRARSLIQGLSGASYVRQDSTIGGNRVDRYIFPAVLEPGENRGYVASFPDLPGCVTEGETVEEALHMAKDALELHLYGLEEDGDRIPEPTAPEKLRIPEGAFVSLVEAWMPVVRDEMRNRAVKKTLTIPKWLNDMAEANKVNFSHVLQAALKDCLGVPEERWPYGRRED